MPKLNEKQDPNHPWVLRAARDIERKKRNHAHEEARKHAGFVCPVCLDPECEFGECTKGDF